MRFEVFAPRSFVRFLCNIPFEPTSASSQYVRICDSKINTVTIIFIQIAGFITRPFIEFQSGVFITC